MAQGHVRTLRGVFHPTALKIVFAVVSVVGAYDSFSNQFSLPRLGKLAGMSGSLLPWWGWLLALQFVFVAGLFEYIRRNVPSRSDDDDNAEARHEGMADIPNSVESRFKGIQTGMEGIWTEINAQKATIRTAAEALKASEDTKPTQVALIRGEVHSLSEQLDSMNIDLTHVLKFAVEDANVIFLDWLISESPYNKCKKVTEYDTAIEREKQRDAMEGYIRGVTKRIAGTQPGFEAAELLQVAEHDAKILVKGTPQNERPANIDPIDWQQYLIAETQCGRLQVFLWQERQRANSRAMAERDMLISRQENRRKG